MKRIYLYLLSVMLLCFYSATAQKDMRIGVKIHPNLSFSTVFINLILIKHPFQFEMD